MKTDKFVNKKPFIIAGPCSAESENQVLETAHQIKDFTDVFRAGIWKPRTKPGSFEGVGSGGRPRAEGSVGALPDGQGLQKIGKIR